MNFIQDNYLTDLSICDDLIDWFNSNKDHHHDGAIGRNSKNIVDKSNKASTDFSFDTNDVRNHNSYNGKEVINRYLLELQFILDLYLVSYSFSSHTSLFAINERVNIQHYKPYEGYKVFHFERGTLASGLRHLVFQTYLNTVEDGGETEFFYQDLKSNAVKGKTLIWPTDWTHTHRGLISPTEDKYVITGWFSFNTHEWVIS